MNCRLCLTPLSKSNQCKAHILPRSLLKEMAGDGYGQVLIVGTDMGRKKRAPTGSYDTEILCRDCDNKLGSYDDLALTFVKLSRHKDHPSGVGWTISNIDQQQLKLFFISYLWRCSITARPEFGGISLGRRHEEAVRHAILANDAGSPNEYTTILARFNHSSDSGQGILFPARTRINGINFYEGYLPNLYKFWIKVDARADTDLSFASLGHLSDIFIHNRGDFDTSVERRIMAHAVRNSQ